MLHICADLLSCRFFKLLVQLELVMDIIMKLVVSKTVYKMNFPHLRQIRTVVLCFRFNW